MGCLFACFRVKDVQTSPPSKADTVPSVIGVSDRAVRRNQLAALFLSEGNDAHCDQFSQRRGVELSDEANLRKLCKEVLETGVENRKEPNKAKDDEKSDTLFKKQVDVDSFSTPDWRRKVIEERSLGPTSKSLEVDRPIIGMVAAHWKEDEETIRVSPKLWDGHGIPNSTNKYKEDQKVSWHATPFEERLEKALSDEKLCPLRILPSGKPIKFDEGEEEHQDNGS